MLLRPNPSSGVPLYLQLMEQVKRAIETGALRPGEQLPGIRPLAEALVINPNVVARAYRELERDRVIGVRDGMAAGVAFAREWGADSGIAVRGRSARDLAIENSRLAAQVAADAATRVERNREIESAREVQQRLLPQSCPPLAGLDYAGACRPVGGVGGDYYDFIRVSDTELGIAVGDVSGKGISAALIMATLRAYLHAHTRRHVTDLAELVASLNRLVYEGSSSNRYATFFYAQYDSSTRVLEYVNAGHNPPLVFRRRGGCDDAVRLDVGGPVVGLMPECSYVAQRVTLDEGDVLLAYTDGISEAMDAAGEEWGDDRLAQVIRSNRSLAARPLIDRIMHAADQFVAGAAQYDDMTVVTARVTARDACGGPS